MDNLIFKNCIGFQWDQWNFNKNQKKHSVYYLECEQVFFNQPLLVYDDSKHSETEKRYYVLGKTNSDRKLFMVFTIRYNLIRVISARDMSKKERDIYEKTTKI